jgi:outer membrane receptor protein involved in Fe transport
MRMRKPCRFLFSSLLWIAVGPLAAAVISGSAAAQTAGKVEGTVTDRDTGQPLPGAQVLIDGTQLGNISDDNGYYFINNVPAGAQTVTASFLGYQTESQQHRILAGQTTTVDFAMTSEVIVADSAIVTVTEREPLVPRDNTISKSRFVREEVADLPLASTEDLISLAAGASIQQGGISLRGARPDDATVYVEGVNATDYANISSQGNGSFTAASERTPLEFGSFSIEQLDVVTGGADASLGDAQSGVVNIVTARGGSELSGALRFTTDAMEIERSDDFYEAEGSIGGPLLGDGKASFFLSGQLQGTRLSSDRFGFDPTFEDVVELGQRFGLDISRDAFCDATSCITPRPDLPLLNIENFVADYLREKDPEFFEQNEHYFNAGDEGLFPGVMFDRYAVQAKLAFTPSASTDIQLAYTRNRDQGQDGTATFQGPLLFGSPFNPFINTFSVEKVDLLVGSWRQIFYQEAERSLALDARLGYFDDRYHQGALYDQTDQANGFPLLEGNRDGDDFLNFRFSDYEIFFADSVDELVSNYDGTNDWDDIEEGIRQQILLGTQIPEAPATQGGGADIFGVGAYGQGGFPLPTIGFPRGDILNAGADAFTNNRERRLNLRADLDAQISRIDRLQGGVDLKFFDVHRVGLNTLSNRLFNTIYFVEPRLFGVYATNRIDLGDFVIDLGARVDHFDHNTLLPEQPGLARTDIGEDGDRLKEYETKTAFGPRLGVAHPVTEDTQVRFSYGVFNQLPGFDELYANVTSDLQTNDLNTNATVGNPDLDFQQTRSFELGITHLLSEDVVLDLVAYNRDIEKGTAARLVTVELVGAVNQLFNVNNGNVRGFDLTLGKRFSNLWSADVTYSYLDSKVTDSDQEAFVEGSGFNSTQDNPVDAPAIPAPADFDVTHKIASSFSLRFPSDFAEGSGWGALLQDFGAFATARFGSGLPYTRQPISSGFFSEPLNASRRASDFQTDVRFTKYFTLTSGVQLGGIFEIFNLFNNENLTGADDPATGAEGITNGVFHTTGTRLTAGNEILDAEQQVTDPVVLADIDTSTPGGALTRELRGFSDIDGDGIVSRQEQRLMGILAFGAANEVDAQPKRQYRLGVEFRF